MTATSSKSHIDHAMPICGMNPGQRRRLLKRLQNNLAEPDGEELISRNLGALVTIVRHTRSKRLEPFLFEILENVCSACPQQSTYGECALRDHSQCPFYRSPGAVIRTIATDLWRIHDREYVATHPRGPLHLD